MSESAIASAREVVAPDLPLAVDMDGTLVRSDTLFEGIVELLRHRPLLAFVMPLWALRGKAAFKREIANRTELDAAFLPYDENMVAHLESLRGSRKVVLCTAADRRFAESVASHLGVFDEVLATDGDVNLNASRKATALVERFGTGGFDYAGNDAPDIEVFAQARRAIVVNPTAALRRRESAIRNVEASIDNRSKTEWAAALARSMRPHQWVKNLLVFVPVLATIQMSRLELLVPASIAFVAFCFVASSVYVLNDLLDLRSDRRHPRKRRRPLAAGTLPLRDALFLVPLLALTGLAIAIRISPLFLGILALYLACTSLYTFWLKRVVLLDTLVLAGLYTLRILAGAAAIAVVPSFWLLAFSMFFFFSVALAKRHAELFEMEGGSGSAIPGRGYRPEDLVTLISQGSASGYAAVLVLALYIDSAAVRSQYNNPEIIWLICPLLLYWINKMWLNAQRREINEDPLVWAMSNRVSRLIALLAAILLLLARWLPPLQ